MGLICFDGTFLILLFSHNWSRRIRSTGRSQEAGREMSATVCCSVFACISQFNHVILAVQCRATVGLLSQFPILLGPLLRPPGKIITSLVAEYRDDA